MTATAVARRSSPPVIPRSWTGAVRRGVLGRCPRCGEGHLLTGFVRVAPACEACGLDLSGHRADDLPPYLVIFVVGHLIGILILESEMRLDVPLWLSLTVWPLITLALALALMRPAKGGVVGLQYGLGMHGFDAIRRRDLASGDLVSGDPGGRERRERNGDVDAGARSGGA
jgi:uncharacterized protein (DUF983 family)